MGWNKGEFVPRSSWFVLKLGFKGKRRETLRSAVGVVSVPAVRGWVVAACHRLQVPYGVNKPGPTLTRFPSGGGDQFGLEILQGLG